VRVAFDEGALTGKFTAQTKLARASSAPAIFAGDRLRAHGEKRVEKIKADIGFRRAGRGDWRAEICVEAGGGFHGDSGNAQRASSGIELRRQRPAALSDELELKLRAHACTARQLV